MRRRAGIGAVQKQKLEQEKYRDKGSELQENQVEQMKSQMEVFRRNLEEFASKHKNEIKKNSTFRRQFQEMCSFIGVDPLASTKGFWSLLNLGDFYFELSVQIVDVCLATSEKNGGLIGLEEVRERLVKARGRSKEHEEITTDDLLRAGKKLKSLGQGFSLVSIGGGKYMVHSVPGELSMDETTVLGLAASRSSLSVSFLSERLAWTEERIINALNRMVQEGLLWVDRPIRLPTLYWFPGLFSPCIAS